MGGGLSSSPVIRVQREIGTAPDKAETLQTLGGTTDFVEREGSPRARRAAHGGGKMGAA